MDYRQAMNRFNVETLMNRLTDLDYINLIEVLNREIDMAENIKIPSKAEYKREIESIQSGYIQDLKGIAFLFEQGIKPGGLDKETLYKCRPIISTLIEKKQLKEEFIKLIE